MLPQSGLFVLHRKKRSLCPCFPCWLLWVVVADRLVAEALFGHPCMTDVHPIGARFCQVPPVGLEACAQDAHVLSASGMIRDHDVAVCEHR